MRHSIIDTDETQPQQFEHYGKEMKARKMTYGMPNTLFRDCSTSPFLSDILIAVYGCCDERIRVGVERTARSWMAVAGLE